MICNAVFLLCVLPGFLLHVYVDIFSHTSQEFEEPIRVEHCRGVGDTIVNKDCGC